MQTFDLLIGEEKFYISDFFYDRNEKLLRASFGSKDTFFDDHKIEAMTKAYTELLKKLTKSLEGNAVIKAKKKNFINSYEKYEFLMIVFMYEIEV